MPTIQEPESFSNVDEPNVDESLDGEKNGGEDTGSASRNATADRKGHSSHSGLAVGFTKHSLMTQVREVSPAAYSLSRWPEVTVLFTIHCALQSLFPSLSASTHPFCLCRATM